MDAQPWSMASGRTEWWQGWSLWIWRSPMAGDAVDHLVVYAERLIAERDGLVPLDGLLGVVDGLQLRQPARRDQVVERRARAQHLAELLQLLLQAAGVLFVFLRLVAELCVLDAEAAQRLSETLLIFFRRTGYAAEERVAWLLGQGGANAVLDEIHELQSNSARRAYSEALVRTQTLDTPTLVRLMRDASRQISSNSQLAGVLGDLFGMVPAIVSVGWIAIASGLLVAWRMPETLPAARMDSTSL